MSNTKHTPGPWIVASDKTSVLQVTPDTDSPFPCVVDCASGYNAMSFGEAKENARLIAAAPDLLAALEALVALHYSWSRGSAYVPVEFEKKNDAAITAARVAITKATGTD